MAKKKETRKRADPTPEGDEELRSYFAESRGLGLSLLMILPLLILYQVGIVQSGSGTRNLAEFWMTRSLALLPWQAANVVNVLVVLGLLYGLWELARGGGLSLGFMVMMAMESVLYSLMLYSGVSVAAAGVDTAMHRYMAIGGVPSREVLLSIGAGVYEELLFRFLLLGGGMLFLRKVFMWKGIWAALLMLTLSALLFSAVHHIEPAGEPFNSFAFIFRAICGFVLGAIFLTRGLGVAVWTHAAYNVIVLVSAAS